MSKQILTERTRALEILELGRVHGFESLATASIARGESATEFRGRLLGHLAAQQLGGLFSFRRMVSGMAGGSINGPERELLEETARNAGKPFDPQRAHLPWSLFTRDLQKATGASGGFLVATDVGEAVDVLRPWSVSVRAGITVIERLTGDMTLPRTTNKSTGVWLASETASATESQPTLGSIALTPKGAGGFIEYSRNLANQANAESYVRRELLRTIGSLVDAAILNGSGVAGQPTGVLATPGIQTQSGTTLGHAGVTNMKEQAATNNADDASIAFLATPAVRELLENRERATGNGYVWDDDLVASRPGYVSTDVPAATMIAGAWSDAVLALWGDGFEFAINPYDPTAFRAGIIQARVIVDCDVAVLHPSAWCVATSIT